MAPSSGKGPKNVQRRSGGMRTSFGGLNEAGLEEQALQAAGQQKQLQQQAGDSSQSSTGGSALKSNGKKAQQTKTRKPRAVGGLKQELVERPLKDMGQELKNFFDINALLNINPVEDSPEEQVRKKKMLQRWNQLTQEEQKVAQEKYKKEMKKKQEEEREKQLKKQKEEEQKKQAIAPPSSPKKGPGMFNQGKGSKGKAMSQLQQQRQTMGTVSSRN